MALGGSNSDEPVVLMDHGAALTKIARDKLKGLVAEIERVEAAQRELAGEKKDIYAVAKASGYDAAAIRATVKRRRQDKQAVAEFEAILDVYLQAVGDIC